MQGASPRNTVSKSVPYVCGVVQERQYFRVGLIAFRKSRTFYIYLAVLLAYNDVHMLD